MAMTNSDKKSLEKIISEKISLKIKEINKAQKATILTLEQKLNKNIPTKAKDLLKKIQEEEEKLDKLKKELNEYGWQENGYPGLKAIAPYFSYMSDDISNHENTYHPEIQKEIDSNKKKKNTINKLQDEFRIRLYTDTADTKKLFDEFDTKITNI